MAPPAKTNSSRIARAMTLSRMMMRRRRGGAAARSSVFSVTRFPNGSRTMNSSSAMEITRSSALLQELHALDVPFVLGADELDELGVDALVHHQLLVHAHGERRRVGLRIVDGDVDLQRAVVQAAEPLGERDGVGLRRAVDVVPPSIAHAGRLDHQRVALPAAYR